MVKAKNQPMSYVVHSFMCEELMLGGGELLVFAIIYSFTKGEKGMFYGAQGYLAKMSGTSISTVKRALASLLKKGYIEKCAASEHEGYRTAIDEESIYSEKHENEPSNAAEALLRKEVAGKSDIREILGNKVKNPKYKFHPVGRDGSVTMTAEQYKRLLSLVGSEMLTNYIRRLELLMKNKGYKTFSPYNTIKKWIHEDASV